MTIKPKWITPSGSLGDINQSVEISTIHLQVDNASAVEIISGKLPPGLRIDGSAKTIEGIPIDQGVSKTYEFVVRAYNNTGANNSKVVQDRTFSINVISDVQPTLLDPPGVLEIGYNKENYVLNNSTLNYQFTATANSIPAGQKLRFYIEEGQGELPPGIKLTPDGLLYGTVRDDLDLDFKVVQGSYDKDYYDINPYDYGSPIEPARATTNLTSGKVTEANIVYGGNGYLLDPSVIVGGSIDTVSITSGGSGYTVAPKVVFENSPVSGGITAQGTASISNGIVTGITITQPGTGYTTAPNIYFQDQNTGSGASASCSLRTGSGAEFVARVSDGTVVELDITNPGSGYALPPLLSFGLPTAGSRIISKTYRFKVTVSNGDHFDTKEYIILVKSEDSLRVDTTFMLSDTVDFDTSSTYIQPPIWLTDSQLPIVEGNNNFIYPLSVFDPTPTVGKLFYDLMDVNFDGTESQLGPFDVEKNRVNYNIVEVILNNPCGIRLSDPRVFEDGARVKIINVNGTTEVNDQIYYLSRVDDYQYELYNDKILLNPINALLFSKYISGGTVHYEEGYLKLDPVGGEINGFIPYQPSITKTYKFTVKVARVLEDVEVAAIFKEFELTVSGNIKGNITYKTPTLVGSLKPNEQSLLKIEAVSSLSTASVNYQVIPGYGKNSDINYVELNLSEINGQIFIEGYGLNPSLTFEKGQSYKINLSLTNFNVSFKNIDNSYYNSGLRHSTGAVGQAAQEKSTGYLIFIPPFDDSSRIKLTYTNKNKDGLFLVLRKYNLLTNSWNRVTVKNYLSENDAYNNNERDISSGLDVFAVIVDYTKVQFTLKKYNTNTEQWDSLNLPTSRPVDPSVNPYYLDLAESKFGILDFIYVGLNGVWNPINPAIVTALPNNSEGTNGTYKLFNDAGLFKILRKINGVWKLLERLPYGVKTVYDPNIFYTNHYAKKPITNLLHDVWFKYTSLFDGYDDEIIITLKSLDNLPTDLTVSLSGDIIGKISPNTGNTYRSYYSANVLYVANDVVTFDGSLFICVNQYRSSGNWYLETDNWQTFNYTKRTTTSIDANTYGVGKFSIQGPQGNDNTTIDRYLRFRVRAKDTQNVSYTDKDFNISYEALSNVNLTNIYLQPFLTKTSRDKYFNFITDPNIFLRNSLYRSEDPNFGVQRIPKMLLLGGIESTTAERYASAVQRNYYDRPLYFGDVKVAIAKNNDTVEYEVIYVEVNDPYEIDGVSVSEKIKLDFVYDLLTVDYSKIRMDETDIVVSDTGLDTIYPSSITLMQNELKKVTLTKNESVLVTPTYDGPYTSNGTPLGWGTILITDPVTDTEDWGGVTERVALIDDFLLTVQELTKDDKYRPLWMNTSQDGTGNPIGYVKAVPICYVKPGESAKILKLIDKANFDFKSLNFTIDRIVIQNPQGETGDKYIKFINREII